MPAAAAASQRRGPGFGQLLGGQQVAGDGADQVVGVAGQRPLGGETGRRRQVRDPPPQPGRGQRGVHVDTGQVGGPVTEHGVQVGGARRGVLRPRRFVPAVPPHRLAGVGGRVVGDHLQALRARVGRAQVQPAERQAGGGQWMWLSTNPGATKPPSRSSTSAPGNWPRPTSSLPSHATTSPRTAMAVASGWVGLCTRPLTSSGHWRLGSCGHRPKLRVAVRAWQSESARQRRRGVRGLARPSDRSARQAGPRRARR